MKSLILAIFAVLLFVIFFLGVISPEIGIFASALCALIAIITAVRNQEKYKILSITLATLVVSFLLLIAVKSTYLQKKIKSDVAAQYAAAKLVKQRHAKR